MVRVVRWVAAAVLGAAFLSMATVSTMQRDHTVELVATFSHTAPAAVWRLLTDHGGEPAWVPAFGAVRRLPDNEGRPVWQIRTADDAPFATLMTIATRADQRYERLLLRDDQPSNQPWDARWVFELSSSGDGTVLRITEYGWTGGFLFFISQRLLGSPDAFLLYYVRRMGIALKDDPRVRVIRSH